MICGGALVGEPGRQRENHDRCRRVSRNTQHFFTSPADRPCNVNTHFVTCTCITSSSSSSVRFTTRPSVVPVFVRTRVFIPTGRPDTRPAIITHACYFIRRRALTPVSRSMFLEDACYRFIARRSRRSIRRYCVDETAFRTRETERFTDRARAHCTYSIAFFSYGRTIFAFLL